MRGIYFVLLTNQFESKQIWTHQGAALFNVQEIPKHMRHEHSNKKKRSLLQSNLNIISANHRC